MLRMIAKVDNRGRIQIPAQIRNRHPEITPQAEFIIEDHGNKLVIILFEEKTENQ